MRPERLPAATQRRLAGALRDGTFRASGTRQTLPVVPRVILVSHLPAAGPRAEEDISGSALDPELVTHMTGWTLRVPPLRERIDDLIVIIESQGMKNSE